MRQLFFGLMALGLSTGAALGAPKPHVISFGKVTMIKWCTGPNEGQCVNLKMRALYVDGRPRESTLGAPHDITERLFVVRRVFRVNDALPGELRLRPAGYGSAADGCWSIA